MNRMSRSLGAVGAAAFLSMASTAIGAQVSFNFSGSVPSGHSAAAMFTFDDVANTVVIRIENTMGAAHNAAESRALTALFWDMTPSSLPITRSTGSPEWTASHGGYIPNPGHGSTIYDAKQLWAYRGDLSSGSTPFGTKFGLSSTGLNAFGKSDMIQSGGPHPPGNPDGINGGILSPTGDVYNGTHQTPFFRTWLEFEISVSASFFSNVGGINNIDVTNIYWQFGSGFNEPGIPETLIPLPTAGGLALAGLLAVGGIRRCRSL